MKEKSRGDEMECQKFQELINDFIYDKIEYSEDLEDFIQHARICQSCKEDLELYYTIHRGLGDATSPYDDDEITDDQTELEHIFNFYDEVFYKQKKMKKAGKISLVVFAAMVICAGIYVYLRTVGSI